MDLKKLAGTLLSSDSISGISSATGATGNEVKKVLSNALPSLLNGAKKQADDDSTSESFVNALSQHAKDNTKDVGGFLGKVDMADGAKIIGHLLGSDKNDIVKDVAKKAGVSQKKTNSILSAIAPLLLSLLGQQTQEEDNSSPIGGLMGSLLGNADMGSLLVGLLGGSSATEEETTTSNGKKKKKKKKKEEEETSGGNSLLSGLFNLLK